MFGKMYFILLVTTRFLTARSRSLLMNSDLSKISSPSKLEAQSENLNDEDFLDTNKYNSFLKLPENKPYGALSRGSEFSTWPNFGTIIRKLLRDVKNLMSRDNSSISLKPFIDDNHENKAGFQKHSAVAVGHPQADSPNVHTCNCGNCHCGCNCNGNGKVAIAIPSVRLVPRDHITHTGHQHDQSNQRDMVVNPLEEIKPVQFSSSLDYGGSNPEDVNFRSVEESKPDPMTSQSGDNQSLLNEINDLETTVSDPMSSLFDRNLSNPNDNNTTELEKSKSGLMSFVKMFDNLQHERNPDLADASALLDSVMASSFGESPNKD